MMKILKNGEGAVQIGLIDSKIPCSFDFLTNLY